MGQYIPFNEAELPFLNNFLAHFPVGEEPYPCHIPEGLQRSVGQSHNFRGKTLRQAMTDLGMLSEEGLKSYFSVKSDKRLDQTPEEFYAVVDKTVQELGMSMELVQKTINIFLHDKEEGPDPRAAGRALDRFLAPIYAALRKKGYNREDLIA